MCYFAVPVSPRRVRRTLVALLAKCKKCPRQFWGLAISLSSPCDWSIMRRMGRGAYEHNYIRLNLPELEEQTIDPAPVSIALPAELAGQGPADGRPVLRREPGLARNARRRNGPDAANCFTSTRLSAAAKYTARASRAGAGGSRRRSRLTAMTRTSTATWPGFTGAWHLRVTLLCESGTLYVHLDWHAVHYVKGRAGPVIWAGAVSERDHLVLLRSLAHPLGLQAQTR